MNRPTKASATKATRITPPWRCLGWSGVLLSCLLLSGCVVSLSPLYEEGDLVTDERLPGSWLDEDGAVWHFAATDGQVYELTYRSEKAEPRTLARDPVPLEARLVQLGEYRFLDLTVDPQADENSLFDLHLLPVHSLWRIEVAGETISLQSLDPRWIESAASSGRVEASFVEVNGWRVLTGSTGHLQDLVQSMASNGEGLEDPGILRRIEGDPSVDS